jgi:hypothetical protein
MLRRNKIILQCNMHCRKVYVPESVVVSAINTP